MGSLHLCRQDDQMAKDHYKVVLEIATRKADGVAFATEWEVLTEWDVVRWWSPVNYDRKDPFKFLRSGRYIVVPYKGKMTMFVITGITATDIRVMIP